MHDVGLHSIQPAPVLTPEERAEFIDTIEPFRPLDDAAAFAEYDHQKLETGFPDDGL
jgi:hypothetical protein